MKSTRLFFGILICLLMSVVHAHATQMKETRAYPSPDYLYFEFENMASRIYSGKIQKQTLPDMEWRGGAQSWWYGTKSSPIEYYFDMENIAPTDIGLYYTKAHDYSIYQVYVNDVYCETIDAYSPVLTTGYFNLTGVLLGKKRNKISFVPVGKNSAASSQHLHMIGLDYIEVSQYSVLNVYSLYIVGSAVSGVGWDYTKAQELNNPGANQDTWEGYLEKGEFKFLYSKPGHQPTGWSHSVNPVSQTDYGAARLKTTDGITDDYKLVVTTPGLYRVTVHKAFMQIQWELLENSPSHIYIVGDATPTGWDNKNCEEVKRTYAGASSPEYKWSGFLKKGHFKFIIQRGTWTSLVPSVPANEPILPGFKHDLSIKYQGDYRFVIQEDGEYDITIRYNEYNNKYALEVDFPDKVQDVYLLGDATPAGWDNNNPIKLDYNTDDYNNYYGYYKWEGYLKPGHFKFITKLGTWNSLVPQDAAHCTVIPSDVGDTYYFSNIYRGDYRFVVEEAGYYKLNLSLKNRWMVLFKSTDLRSAINMGEGSSSSRFSLISSNGGVQVKVDGTPAIQKAQLVTLTGRTVDMYQNVKGGFVLGNGLPAGVYIVNIVYDNNQVFTRKVNIR